MFTAIIPILCNINPCMLFLLSIEKKKKNKKNSVIGDKDILPIFDSYRQQLKNNSNDSHH